MCNVCQRMLHHVSCYVTEKYTYGRDSQPFRSRAISLPGANRPIEPWPIRSLELLLPGLFAPCPCRIGHAVANIKVGVIVV